MNIQQRRQLVRARVIDVKIAKAAINQSRRDRYEAAVQLRKALDSKSRALSDAASPSYSLPAAG